MGLRYGWERSSTSKHCERCASFTDQYVLSCPRGGFRHNELRGVTVGLLSEAQDATLNRIYNHSCPLMVPDLT